MPLVHYRLMALQRVVGMGCIPAAFPKWLTMDDGREYCGTRRNRRFPRL
jgi:hypothetical protein